MTGNFGQNIFRNLHTSSTISVVEIHLYEIVHDTLNPLRMYLENMQVQTLKIKNLIVYDDRARYYIQMRLR